MNNTPDREAAQRRVSELVRAFHRNETDYLRADYNETQARTDFITPLLEAFGWDVHNQCGHPLALREVIEEATVEVGEERLSKKPDYELRLARQRKLFVEAKKPSVRIDRNRAAAFQARRYGYSASLPISVLTNFHQLAIYDCLPVPSDADDARVARTHLVSYREYEDRFDELWSLLSRATVYSGDFDRHFAVGTTRRGADQFDDFFLAQVQDWRGRLAADMHANTPGLTARELTFAVQLFISRIVFLRICEDREIERYETLRGLGNHTFDALMAKLREADQFYDSGLFRLLDDERLGLRISDATLQSIIEELYYPQSPYTFAVVEAEVLGEIYEQFLGDVISVSDDGIEIIKKPEVREGGGVVPTPRFVADRIADRTIAPLIEGKSPAELAEFSVADICCGSGIFLLSTYELLLDHHLTWYQANNPAAHTGHRIFEATANQWRLTYDERRRILLTHIRAVDIDSNAVEIARFSLLLKLIEGETAEGLREFVTRNRQPALPLLDNMIRCGNSLVSAPEWRHVCGMDIPEDLMPKINPLTWEDEFPDEMARGGFNAIIGNPPYIRIQHMTHYSPEEVDYYHNPASPYTTARQDNYDKYALFIERVLTLVQPAGRIGYIVPHKFMTIQAGRALRALLTSTRTLDAIVHFGVKQVFGAGATNYTCILFLDETGSDTVSLERPGALESWRYGEPGIITEIPAHDLGDDPWRFADESVRLLFRDVRDRHPVVLKDVAEIFVGVQTSADNVYIIHPTVESATNITCRWNNRDWQIEREILRPCLHDISLQAFARPQANAWMIFPYEVRTSDRGNNTAHLIQPDDFAQRFPVCWAYLCARRELLEGRNIVGGRADERQWYQFGRSQSLSKFNTAKIILPVLSTEPRYAYDDRNSVVTGGGNGPYYMVRPKPNVAMSNYFLLALLNHPLSEAFVRTHTSEFRGGYYSHGKQFIQDLPVPDATDDAKTYVEALVEDLIDALTAANEARTPHARTLAERRAADLHSLTENAISEIFGLDEADLATIHTVPVPE